MKRVLSLFLILVIAVLLTGCKKENKTSEHSIDVEYYAKLGKIPEIELSLHTSEKEVTDYYGDGRTIDAGDHDHYVELTRTEGELAVRLDAGNTIYYYEKANVKNGISVIVSFDTAYDFEVGISMPDDIKAAIAAEGTLTDATEDQLYFLPFVEGGAKVLSYTFDDNRLDFFFINDFLSATVLTDTNNWTD